MTAKYIGTRETTATVRVRADGRVDEESLAYLREKVGTALDRPGLPPVSGDVRIVRATAHHIALPWSAGAEIRVGGDLVVVHAREATARELADPAPRPAARHHRTRRPSRRHHPPHGRTAPVARRPSEVGAAPRLPDPAGGPEPATGSGPVRPRP